MVYNSQNVYIGNDGGINYSTDAGLTWYTILNDFPFTQFYGFDAAVFNNTIFMGGGTQDNGVVISTNNGANWNIVTGGDGYECDIDETNPSRMFCRFNGSFSKTTNWGVNWSPAGTREEHQAQDRRLDSAVKKIVNYLEAKQTKDGGFGVANRDQHYNQWSLSGVGILGLQTMAHGSKTSEVKKGLKFLHEFLTAEPLDWNKHCNLYCWYYYTQAFFQGGEEWKFYNQMFLPQILSAQQPDGCFKRGRPNYPAGDAADEIYRQCLCTLQLESYYRYLKVGDREEQSFFDK